MPSGSDRPVSVCLVRCPTITSVGAVGEDAVPPLGLAYLAGALAGAGHRVRAVDAVGEALDRYEIVPALRRCLAHGLSAQQTAGRIPADAEIIGLSAMFSVDWLMALQVARQIRALFPDALVIAGGEHATACAEEVLNGAPEIDACVLGEGEETLVHLAHARRRGEGLSSVPGLALRRGGRVERTPPRPRIRDVDSIPSPLWEIFPVEAYLDRRLAHGADLGRSLPILASRGCPYQCTFCSAPSMWTTRWAARKPELVIAEMKRGIRRYGAQNFDFYDLTAVVRRDWILDFCRKLAAEDLGVTWQLPHGTRSEAIDAEVAHWMRRSGARIMNYAPESGSAPELSRIKKKVDLSRMLASMRASRRAGLEITANFIFGLPGSTAGDVARTFWFIAKLAWIGIEGIHAFGYSPYPGTENFRELAAAGRVRLDAAYFESLLAYTDPLWSVSYCEGMPTAVLRGLNFAAMAWFYGLSLLLRPWRAARLAYRLATGDRSSKLTMAWSNRARRATALRQARLAERAQAAQL